jgi:hypothetical protein
MDQIPERGDRPGGDVEQPLPSDAVGPWRDDLITAVLATTLVGGLFLDGWNHINLQNGTLGSFFTTVQEVL